MNSKLVYGSFILSLSKAKTFFSEMENLSVDIRPQIDEKQRLYHINTD